MSPIQFLAEWALRSSILICAGAIVIWLVRVKDPAVRLAAWIAVLTGSMLIPVMTMALPATPVRVLRAAVMQPQPTGNMPVEFSASAPSGPVAVDPEPPKFNWLRAGLMLYAIVAAGMLLRLCIGLVLGWRMLRRARRSDQDIFTSRDIAAPATLGVLRPVIVLPEDWPTWEASKLDSVLAHERSHIARYDPAVQLLSAIHRALLWFSPAVWFLHSKIVRVAEEISDDAAIAVTADRAGYAGMLVEFMQRPALDRDYLGVPMSRYGSADRRIQRILDSSQLSRGMTRLGFAAILVVSSPLVYFTATAAPAAQSTSAASKPTITPSHTTAGPGRSMADRPPDSLSAQPVSGVLLGLGTVHAGMVTVRTQIDGPLKSVNFREGQPIHAGDVVAVIEASRYEGALARVVSKANLDLKRLQIANERYTAGTAPIDAMLTAQSAHDADLHEIEDLKGKIANAQIKAPVSGVAGLRLVEPGNMVQPTDRDGIVTIAEVQPISVLFTLPERILSKVRPLLDSGKHPVVEAWNAEQSTKLATGLLTAMDNQIDAATGTVKLKATFNNKDGKLYPHQFVNVKILMK